MENRGGICIYKYVNKPLPFYPGEACTPPMNSIIFFRLMAYQKREDMQQRSEQISGERRRWEFSIVGAWV